jgi:hypothetical protein
MTKAILLQLAFFLLSVAAVILGAYLGWLGQPGDMWAPSAMPETLVSIGLFALPSVLYFAYTAVRSVQHKQVWRGMQAVYILATLVWIALIAIAYLTTGIDSRPRNVEVVYLFYLLALLFIGVSGFIGMRVISH